MKYIFIGMILNSIVTSTHDSEEACKGREAILKEKGVVGQCVKELSNLTYSTSGSIGSICLTPNGMARSC